MPAVHVLCNLQRRIGKAVACVIIVSGIYTFASLTDYNIFNIMSLSTDI